MAFPADVNALGSVSGSQTLAAAGHATRHNEVKTALEGIRDALGGTAVPSGTVQPILAAGSASAPSLSFTGDSNTGLWSPGADTVAFSTGGSERLRITSAGNVGIGTSSPSTALHVKSAWVTDEGQIIADVPSGGTYSGMTLQNDGTIKGLAIWDNANSRLMLNLPGTSGAVSLGFNSTSLGIVYDGTNNRMSYYSQGGDERLRVSGADGLITGTGTSLGAWTAYTPTLGGTGWAIGNGTAEGKYCQVGKIVHFWARITLGSTSTAGAGACTVTVPVAPTDGNRFAIKGSLWDASASQRYAAQCDQSSGSEFAVRYISSAAGLFADVTTSAPFAWTTSDFIQIDGTYSA